VNFVVKNGSKIWLITVSFMPQPSSLTSIRM